MKERPILFSAPMVRALLAGTKTQTRRLVTAATSDWGSVPLRELDLDSPLTYRDGTKDDGHVFMPHPHTAYLHAPRRDDDGTRHRVYPRTCSGARLWVRETWRAAAWSGEESPPWATIEYRADHSEMTRTPPDGGDGFDGWDKICKRAGWVLLEEGWVGTEEHPELPWRPSIFMPRWASRITLEVTAVRVERLQEISEGDARAEGVEPWSEPRVGFAQGFPHVGAYADLWDSINRKRAPWVSNPWVWVIEFRRIGT